MRAIGWSLFLACSWTWCIGMYLPALVLRDYGWWGFLVFAAPNVIGAGAFGYVLRNRKGSERFLARHTAAARAFSCITIAFHMYWVPMVLMERFDAFALGASWQAAGAVGLLVFVIGWALGQAGSTLWRWLATLLYCASALMLLATLATGDFAFALPRAQAYPTWHVAFLVLASCFGFALCPYLDLTFHRALRESPSRHSFLGFGVAFSLMIFFTAVYFVTGFDALILLHVLAQATFTVGVHLRELRSVRPRPAGPGIVATRLSAVLSAAVIRRGRRWLILLPALAVLAALPLRGTEAREFTYQAFMTMYGLVFPLYIFMFALPRPLAEPDRRGAVQFAVAALMSLPAFYLAFVAHIPYLLAYPFVALAIWWWSRRGKVFRGPAASSSPAASTSPSAAALADRTQ